MSFGIVIARHGNTFSPGETPRRIGVRTDIPLVDSGRIQATRLGVHFAELGLRFDRILASPLRRTSESARLIVGAMSTDPVIERCDWLAEIDHGPDENLPDEKVEARIGRQALDAWDRLAISPPGWTVDAAARIAAWRDFFETCASTTVLLVTSNGAARFALMALGSADPAPDSLKLRTGAYGRLRVQDGRTTLEGWDVRP